MKFVYTASYGAITKHKVSSETPSRFRVDSAVHKHGYTYFERSKCYLTWAEANHARILSNLDEARTLEGHADRLRTQALKWGGESES